MNKKYLLKSLLLIIFVFGAAYYFLTSPASKVSIQSIWIVGLTLLWFYEEMRSKELGRNLFQLIVDRGILFILILLSLDVAYSLVLNGVVLK